LPLTLFPCAARVLEQCEFRARSIAVPATKGVVVPRRRGLRLSHRRAISGGQERSRPTGESAPGSEIGSKPLPWNNVPPAGMHEPYRVWQRLTVLGRARRPIPPISRTDLRAKTPAFPG